MEEEIKKLKEQIDSLTAENKNLKKCLVDSQDNVETFGKICDAQKEVITGLTDLYSKTVDLLSKL